MRPEAMRRQPGCTPARQALLLSLLVLQGCASVAPTPASAPAAKPAAAAPRPATLAVERQWLQSWFAGTPVRIEQRSEAEFSVKVPREFCFDSGRSAVKPPLAAVLDKVAQSLQRKPELRIERLAAPGDGSGTSALAQHRAEAVRKHLVSRGVASAQLAAPAVAAVPAVQLHIGLAAH